MMQANLYKYMKFALYANSIIFSFKNVPIMFTDHENIGFDALFV